MRESRLARFFLRRLRHAAEAEALQRAVRHGLLFRTDRVIGSVSATLYELANGILALPLAVLRRKLGFDRVRRGQVVVQTRNDSLAHLRSGQKWSRPKGAKPRGSKDGTKSRTAATRAPTRAAYDAELESVVADLRASAGTVKAAPRRKPKAEKAASTMRESAVDDFVSMDVELEPEPESTPPRRTAKAATADGARRSARGARPRRDRKAERALRERFVRLVRASALPPDPVDVATLLLLARSVEESGLALRAVLDRLSVPTPIVTIRSCASGFEDRLMKLLREGMVLPFPVATHDGYGIHAYDGMAFPEGLRNAQPLIAFRSQDTSYAGNRTRLSDDVARAVAADMPIVAIAEGRRDIPAELQAATHLDLSVGPLDADLVGRVIAAVLGSGPQADELGATLGDCSRLRLADLATAIRPGLDPDEVAAVLARLAAMRLQEPEEKPDRDDEDDDGSWRKRRDKPGSGSERIEPETPPRLAGQSSLGDLALASDPYLSVETLSGYGAAKDWALAVRQDLDLWRQGRLDWSDMSTRILLSGPPGTGKTTFARALCNTLQVPLLVTSVPTWLEANYLGSVVKRMKAAFEEAERARPAILFIDEIDALGKRQAADRDHADYWNTLVNRALELLDGVKSHEGIIVVGATNRPDELDPALRRSGRLERHVTIDLPNTEALMGIFRHHLGTDFGPMLEAVAGDAHTHDCGTGRSPMLPEPHGPPTASGRSTRGWLRRIRDRLRHLFRRPAVASRGESS